MATKRKRKDSYTLIAYAGYDSNNKQIVKTKTWRPPLINPNTGKRYTEKAAAREAQHLADLYEEEILRGYAMNGHIKFAECAERWKDNYANIELRNTTCKNIPHQLEVINAAIGHIYIDQLNYAQLSMFYSELEKPYSVNKYICTIDMKQRLKEEGISKKAFAERSEVSLYTMRKIYKGDELSLEEVKKISKALNCNIKDIFKVIAEKKQRSQNTVNGYKAVVSSILSWAVSLDMIPSNVTIGKKYSKKKKIRKEAYNLDDEEARRLLNLLENEPISFRAVITVLLYTGMRRGEALGLKWSDVDFEDMIVDINKTVSYTPANGVYLNDTKNGSSKRCIKVPHKVIEVLKELKEHQDEERLRLGTAWEDSGFIFTNSTGGFMRPDSLGREFRKFREKNGFSSELHLHSLRHTSASLMIASGVNLATVANRLGHVNASTTSKIYSHAIKKLDAKASDVLEDILKI